MWRRWTCWLAAVLLISACSHATLTRVVRTDGSEVVGELLAARPDAVVLKVADGSSVTIPRSMIRTIESAQTPTSVASHPPTAPPVVPNPSHTPATSTPTPTPTSPLRPTPTNPTPTNPTPTNPTATPAPHVARDAIAPSGATLELTLNTPIGSDTSTVDDKVDAVLRVPLVVNGDPILDSGAVAHGVITEATPADKAEGRGRLTVRFDTLQLGTRTVAIQTAPVHWEAPGITKPAPKPRDKGFFHRVVDKTKKGLRIKDDDAGPHGSAEVRFAAGATLRIRLEQPAHLAP